MDSEEIEGSFKKLSEELKNFIKKDKRSELSVEDYSKFL